MNDNAQNADHTDNASDNPRKIAHDLNNAMSAIVGSVDLALLRTAENDPARKYFSQIGASADRATDLIHRLIAILRRDYPDCGK